MFFIFWTILYSLIAILIYKWACQKLDKENWKMIVVATVFFTIGGIVSTIYFIISYLSFLYY